MAIDDIVTDETLKSVLAASHDAQQQTIELLELVSKSAATSPPSPDVQLHISKQQKLLFAYLSQLRGLHRDVTFEARETKVATAEARQEVDRLHLQLQNLYYEQRHLQGEITACESYEYVDY